MRKRRWIAALLLLLAAVLFLHRAGPEAYAQEEPKDRGKLTIGYCQAGDYYEFDYQIYQIGMALVDNGTLTSQELTELKQGDSAKDVWHALSLGESDRYRFDADSFFDITSAEFTGADASGEAEEDAVNRLLAERIRERDIDLMITMGTSAGLAVKACPGVPYMNFIASDPVSSGIVGGAEYSGDERGWAHVNDGVEEKALRVMNDIFTFETLGIVYSAEDPEAYIYSGAASLDSFAEANGKSVLTEYVTDEFEDTEEAYRAYYDDLYAAHQSLADAGIDLFILTTSYLELEDYYEVLLPFIEKGIPVFSLNSTEDVRCGALAAVEMIDYQNVGFFAADTLGKYQEGESLDRLPQRYPAAPFLVLNVHTMRQSGIRLPLDTLISASKIYGKYEGEGE
ncbi:MAG: hypothetical protein IJP92_06215 [Lachnospiraceae bacterium]|nr:hypothetical protein [Lachnospiraceae bacterium]